MTFTANLIYGGCDPSLFIKLINSSKKYTSYPAFHIGVLYRLITEYGQTLKPVTHILADWVVITEKIIAKSTF